MADIRRDGLRRLDYDEDHETWEAFKGREDFRWLFNKLEVALRQNLHAGPAGTAPAKSGLYVSRPTYNIYGMGIGAHRFEYHTDQYEAFINHAVVPPGHFWCEWLPGPQLSIDYEFDKFWKVRSIWMGEHYDAYNLTKFKSWTRLDNSLAPMAFQTPLRLPWFGTGATQKERDLVDGFNVEIRDGKVIEVHLRFGNDPFDDLPVGTVLTPIWDDQEIPTEGEFRGNLHEDMTKYSANGNLNNVRKGFLVTRPSENS